MAITYSETFRETMARGPMGGTPPAVPATYDIGLFAGDPNNGGVECTGVGYARLSGVANDLTTWALVPGTNNRTYRNAIPFEWSAAVGSGWGTPNYVCFFTPGTSQILWAISIDNATPLATGEAARILAGGLTAQLLN